MFAALLNLTAVTCGADTTALPPGRHNLTIDAAGHTWRYTVQVPKGLDRDRRVPLVLILHGSGGTGPMYLDRCGWAEKADREGFVAVAPTGLPPRPQRIANSITNPHIWNTGQVRDGVPRAKVDDKVFFVALLDAIAKRVPIDPDRVYVIGHSNGAGMAFQLGAELSDRFASIAAYAGYCWLPEPKPAHPRSTFFLVGTDDPLTPLEGGGVRPPWGATRPVPSVADSLARWAKGLGCPTEPEVLSDKDGVKKMRYGPAKNGVALTAWYIDGQGHLWPGGSEPVLPTVANVVFGPSGDKVNATDVIWDFFKQYKR
jgi:polyhydroxybutyrate depolymerase